MCILVLLGAEGGCFDDNFDYDDFQNRGRRWAIACLLFGVSAPALFLIFGTASGRRLEPHDLYGYIDAVFLIMAGALPRFCLTLESASCIFTASLIFCILAAGFATLDVIMSLSTLADHGRPELLLDDGEPLEASAEIEREHGAAVAGEPCLSDGIETIECYGGEPSAWSENAHMTYLVLDVCVCALTIMISLASACVFNLARKTTIRVLPMRSPAPLNGAMARIPASPRRL
jgi:hypothetical protein